MEGWHLLEHRVQKSEAYGPQLELWRNNPDLFDGPQQYRVAVLSGTTQEPDILFEGSREEALSLYRSDEMCERFPGYQHGGTRPGAGRPSLEGKLVPVDMPQDMIEALNDEVEKRKKAGEKINRAQLVRELVRKGLEM
jgi:hypothetical protein